MGKRNTGVWSKRAKKAAAKTMTPDQRWEAREAATKHAHEAPALYRSLGERMVGPPPHIQKSERRSLRILKTLEQMSALLAEQDYRLDFVDPSLGDVGDDLHLAISKAAGLVAYHLACYTSPDPQYYSGCTTAQPGCLCFHCAQRNGTAITPDMVKKMGGIQ